MAEYPSDRFDDVPAELGRVGAHRAPAPRSRGGVIAGVIALATGMLVGLGLLALQVIDSGLDLGTPPPVAQPPGEPEPEVTPVTDPATVQLPEGFTITVLNGAGIAGLGQSSADVLTDADWPVGAVTNAASSDIETTTVYYSNPADEGIALGMVELLGLGTIELSDAFAGAPITVVVGADAAG
ncbi:MAG: LytR C-terminal domain-containing protein [Microcella sp.]|uniref:LytR C-terminal domain-containing protein n=1 Tax=Microcella sp. TaxID=1913979 RepID=UPI002722E87A|nr:LytR C-terminal domain-containing protein [Microcella sp.]MDO8336790.1 LytR C-terminal domain-containing protein [Microcella sp.]